MQKLRFVGLDVHRDSITIAVADQDGSVPEVVATIPNETQSLLITRTGNRHARKILVESAWSYRFKPAMSYEIRRRNEGVAPQVQAIAWKAQQRLHGRYKRLLGRGKTKQQTVTALARELAGFVRAIAREPALVAA